MNTDDLRESPNLELAERFVGKGLEVRIYDPIVNPAKLIGANLATSRASWPTSAGSSWTGPSSPSRTRRSSS